MAGIIYLAGIDGELVEMTEKAYDSEDVLQTLIAQYPNLLAGDQMNASQPRRWVLVKREMALPDDEVQAGRWSVDHLFLDQEGIPTLIEVKRSTDTRLRREVVGQLLEYAANAVLYWPLERIASEFETACELRGVDPDQELQGLLGADSDLNDFWDRVGTNLSAGKIRLVFVGDVIPSELRRIVEFLNEQMSPADVFCLEVKQYVGSGLRTLVPRLVGATERKRGASQSAKRRWDEIRFLDALRESCSPGGLEAAREVLTWARGRKLRDWWGTGSRNGSFIPVLDHKGNAYSILSMWTEGRIEVLFQYFVNWVPFDSKEKRLELAGRLNAVPGVEIPENATERRPSISLDGLSASSGTQDLLRVFNWVVEQFQAA